ncbi:SDR family NAD(P)-dependent oxidoreductase [Bacillus taeanensis]|nr:SDR family NAD(P)-dependent oxidoreductase [Bacillus taeanensis]
MLLQNKTAVITGSSRGIGREAAVEFAKQGANVIVNGRNEQTVQEVVQIIRNNGGKAVPVIGSVSDAKTAASLVKAAVFYFGKLDILVNNAGVTYDRISYKMTEEEWDDVINSHAKGTFLCSKAAVSHMKERGEGGSIINLTSLAGFQGTVGQLNYSAAKAAVNAMTWTLANELRRFQINVNAVAPAALTDMTKPIIEKVKKETEKSGTAFPDYWKIGTASEAARFITALASQSAAKLSGKIFSVNGSQLGMWEQSKHYNLYHSDQSLSIQEILQILKEIKDESQQQP